MYINSKLVRTWYIWKTIKKIIEEKWITLTSIEAKVKIAQPTISNTLNGKRSASDEFFRKIAKAIPLTEKEIDEIFMNADIEELKYKYWEDFLTKKEYSFEELLEMVGEQKNLTAEELQAVRKFIEFTGWEK